MCVPCVGASKLHFLAFVYRPPTEYTDNFLIKLNDILSTVCSQNDNGMTYFGGWNIDFLKHNENISVLVFINLMYSYFTYPLIT